MELSCSRHVFEVIGNNCNELLNNPEIYIEPQPKKTEDFKQLSKKFYAIAFENNKFEGRCLPQLLIRGFDEEQIWQQSDLLNKAASSNISQIVHSINLKNINLAVSKYQQLQQSIDKNIDILKDEEASNFYESDSDVEIKDDSDDEMKDDSDEEDYSTTDFEDNNEKTAFEFEQEKAKKKIQECEKSMLEPLPWHLTGEVDASKRPIDSLMDVEADCDTNKKQNVLVDQELTEKIEAIMKMAIMNKAFSDVERKRRPTAEEINYEKEVALDQTKSKKGLAEIYEEDFLKKQSKDEQEEDPKHKEIKKSMDSLFPQLNALFSHIPKPAIPDIKIVSNLPAVTVEEVAPTSVSDVTLLAPEEVKKKSGMIKGKTERDETDRKRERRKKKIHQKLKEKKRLEKLESFKSNPSAKISKLEKLDALKKLKQHKNTKIAKVNEGGKIKSSKDFFSRLQDTMDAKKKTKSNVLYN